MTPVQNRLLVGLALVMLALAAWAPAAGVVHRLNADGLYLAGLYQDLVERGAVLRQCYLQPAPSFFPDMAVFFPLRRLGGSVAAAHAGFALFLLAGWTWISRRAWLLVHGNAMPGRLTALLLAAFLFLHSFSDIRNSGFLIAAHHTGSMLAAAAMVVLVLEILYRPKPWSGGLLVLVTALTVFSDLSVLTASVLPLVIFLVLLGLSGQVARGRFWLSIGALAASTMLALLTYLNLRGAHPALAFFYIPPTQLGWTQPPSIHTMDAHLLSFGKTLAGNFMLVAAALAACVLPLRSRQRSAWLAEGDSRLALLLILCVLISSASVFAMGIGAATRYFHAALLFPFFLGAPLWMRGRWIERSTGIWAATLVLAGAGFGLNMVKEGHFTLKDPYPAWIEKIDQALPAGDGHAGYADYWRVKPLNLFSKKKLSVACIHGEEQHLEHNRPNLWIGSAQRFTGIDDKAPRPIFVYTDRLQETVLKRDFGNPARIKEVERGSIWIYDRPQDIAFRHFWRSYLFYGQWMGPAPLIPSGPKRFAMVDPGFEDIRQKDYVVIPAGHHLDLKFELEEEPVIGELWGVAGDGFDVGLSKQGETIATLNFPALSGELPIARFAVVPKAARQGFDQARILPSDTNRRGLVGHLIFWNVEP